MCICCSSIDFVQTFRVRKAVVLVGDKVDVHEKKYFGETIVLSIYCSCIASIVRIVEISVSLDTVAMKVDQSYFSCSSMSR